MSYIKKVLDQDGNEILPITSTTAVLNPDGTTTVEGRLQGIETNLMSKQDSLVSGVNIKTVNGQSLLGSGNINTESGGVEDVTVGGTSVVQSGVAVIPEIPNGSDFYKKAAGSSQPSGGFLPDVVYALGPVSGNVTFELAPIVVGNVNHYFWSFSTSNSVPTITWPSRIIWQGGTAPTVSANRYYEISILNSMAVYLEMELEASV